VAADRHACEVHDQVGALSEAHQEPVVVVGGQVDRCGEEATLVADGPDLHTGDLLEVQNQETRLAAVEKPESIAPLVNGEEWPRVPVGHDHVAEELRIPDRGELPCRNQTMDDAVEESLGVGIEQ
jgi:hypothetical protein